MFDLSNSKHFPALMLLFPNHQNRIIKRISTNDHFNLLGIPGTIVRRLGSENLRPRTAEPRI